MQLIDTEKLCNEIYSLKRARDEITKPIIKKYQECIDDVIFQELPFKYGDILKKKIEGKAIYFVYKGIKDESMLLYKCDENGIETKTKIECHWSTYDDFEIHKN